MSILMVFIILIVMAALVFTGLMAVWVYQDARERGDRGWMWVCIILLSSPVLGGLLYLIARREERRPCRFCGWMVDRRANFCEHCGKQFPVCGPGSGYLEDLPAEEMSTDRKKMQRNRRFLLAIVISALVMIASLIGSIITAVDGGMDADIGWNTGWVLMNVEKTWDNVWTFRYNKASEDYHVDSRLQVEDPDSQKLSVNLTFTGSEQMLLRISQQEGNGQNKKQEFYLGSSEQTQYFDLDQFLPGKIKVSFYNSGASDVSATVTVTDPS